ncbi:MAG: hypothetical protein M3326_02860 [Actinomycetota bacterium]|nr:hypothetical protein [Actinomycetota bacterium]
MVEGGVLVVVGDEVVVVARAVVVVLDDGVELEVVDGATVEDVVVEVGPPAGVVSGFPFSGAACACAAVGARGAKRATTTTTDRNAELTSDRRVR